MPLKQARGDRAIRWIQDYCLLPSGLDKGQHVRLTPPQRDIVREIYDNPNGPHGAPPVTGTLAAYLALLHMRPRGIAKRISTRAARRHLHRLERSGS